MTVYLKARNFEQANTVLKAPPGSEDKVYDLPICRPTNYPGVVSCWEVPLEAIHEISKTRRIYLMVQGRTHPPVILVTDVFDELEEGGT